MKTIRETSMQIAQSLIEKASLTDNQSVLEPSAGVGNILDCIRNNYTFDNLQIDCVELNKEKFIELKSKGYNAFNADFLSWQSERLYDRIIACPPFKGNSDIFHIKKMYELLERKGIMVTLTSPNWVLNNEPHQVQFREWLIDKNYSMTMLPDNSFMEKGKTVPTMILKIFKR